MTNPEVIKKIADLKDKYPQRKSSILPALHIILNEIGYINQEMLNRIAEALELSPLEVSQTASFYTYFPKEGVGKYHIQVCTNLSCTLLGAEGLLKYLEQKLGIKVGETTPDGWFTLSTVECLGSCGTAPVMQINQKYYENLTKQKVDKIIANLRNR
jgi:NADH-quinone oxidoreductase subunit E